MRTSRTGSSTEAGFTLIELAVVVLLIGLFSALVIPRLPSLAAGDGARATRRIAGTVKFLFNEAALSGREHRLIFDLDHGRLLARQLTPGGELVEVRGLPAESSLPSGVKLLDVAVSGREKVASGSALTPILPAGWLPETVIHLSSNGETTTVRLLAYTGTAEVYDGYREF